MSFSIRRYSGPVLVLLFFALLQLQLMAVPSAGDEPPVPRLVVIVVVDGLGQDQVRHHAAEFSKKGLGRFLSKGAWFESAFYNHAATFTAVGHATISTGTQPYRHGIVGNDWLDPVSGEKVYCVSDPESPVLGENRSRTASPRPLKVSTIGDQLKLANSKSKVLSVATKDRAAVLTAGHLGQAYFFSSQSGRFVTSRYYMETFPSWWEDYYSGKPEIRWYERWKKESAVERGSEIPGPQAPEEPPSYSHIGEETISYDYILEFAKAAVRGEKLGEDDSSPDILILGLSAHDYVNHDYGPGSPESRASLLRVDRMLQELLEFLEKEVGLDSVVVALTADHGFAYNPELPRLGKQDVGRIDASHMRGYLNQRLSEEFGEADYLRAWLVPGFYLNSVVLAEKGIDRVQLERFAREALRQYPGVEEVYSRSQLEYGDMPRNELAQLVANSWRPDLGPDLWVVQKSGWYLLDKPDGNAATHGSPYSYDRNVPLMLLGERFAPGRHSQTVGVVDLAPTLVSILGVPVPSGSEGRVLDEAFRR